MSPRRAAAPQRGREHHFSLSVQLQCDCGQTRSLQMRRRPMAVADHGNSVVAPCCLRRYRVVRWEDGGPVFECYGVESWKSGKLEIVPIEDARAFTDTMKRHKRARAELSFEATTNDTVGS